jgi:hypothetical protein
VLQRGNPIFSITDIFEIRLVGSHCTSQTKEVSAYKTIDGKLNSDMGTHDKNAEFLESFVMPTEFSLFTRCQNLDGKSPVKQAVPCTVICAGGCGTTFLGKVQTGRVVENKVVHMGWLNGLTMVRIFACKTCGANPSGTEVIYLPRLIKVFEWVAGAADHKVCFLSKNGGLYKNEKTVSILIETLDKIEKLFWSQRGHNGKALYRV